MGKARQKELMNLWLSQIVNKIFKSSIAFEELESSQKGLVIWYIHENNIPIKIFEKIGFDIIRGKFFVLEYIYTEDNPLNYNIERNEFDSFEAFFEHVQGNIYDHSCYYGYSFSQEEIEKYSLDISKLNMRSFIDYDISQNTFESVLADNDEENQEDEKNGIKIRKWILEIKCIDSYDLLLKEYENFKTRFLFYDNVKIFFSLIIQKFGDSIKDYLIEFRRHNDPSKGIDVDDILFYYGVKSAEQILVNFDGGCWTRVTINNRKNKIMKKIELFQDNHFIIKKRGYFSESSQLFIVNYLFYENNERVPYMIAEKCLLLFNDFAKELDGDLSGINLENAPISRTDVYNYKIDEKTKLPKSYNYTSYKVKKYYDNERFWVEQIWLDEKENVIISKEEEFQFFCDFAHYLNNDLSNSNLIMCDGIDNIAKKKDLNLEGVRVRGQASKKLNIKSETISKEKYKLIEFQQAQSYELTTINELQSQRAIDDEYNGLVSYITDIHMLHRFDAWKCETYEDMDYVTKIITKEIGGDNLSIRVKLIGGDVASDFDVYKSFVTCLREVNKNGKIFYALGNHELWPFRGFSLDSIVDKYKEVINLNGMYLVHNNLFYFDDVWKEITTQELKNISSSDLRKKMRGAALIIFGGIGFAGKNKEFNADMGIYRKIITREQEIEESRLFESLYLKVADALYDKNVIVFTHMPMKDWTLNNYTKGFVYVSGHNHRNYFYDDGVKRIYSDNQIGYRQKNIYMKNFSIRMDYDWFSDYKDGIYEITKSDYINFYRGICEYLSFKREYDKLYMLKREGIYMFLMKSPKGTLFVLNGGAIKKANGHSVEYFYENLVTYSKSIKMFLSQFDEFQKNVSKEIKSIGGDGTIHGSIVDIDFCNHLYLNPLDRTITPYFAYSMVEKYVYKNIPSLLKYQCPQIYKRYKEKLLEENQNNNALIIVNENLPITNSKKFVESTEMYRVSRILKGLQFTTKYNIIRLWNDTIIGDSSEEKGRLIVSGIINPEEMELIHKQQKLIENEQKKTTNLSDNKIKSKSENPPELPLTQEELLYRLERYRNKLAAHTQTIEVVEYNGAKHNAKYKCKLCGHTWEQRPDCFKGRGSLHYVCKKCKR
ncbi:MAG: hypothetical protein K5765_04355 [Clostridia bacterium]|nr:hypothetical protein [Clostridia bacterium]